MVEGADQSLPARKAAAVVDSTLLWSSLGLSVPVMWATTAVRQPSWL